MPSWNHLAPYLSSVWISETAKTGWALGLNGTIHRYAEGTWERDEAASSLTSETLLSLWFSKSGDRGWVAGQGGTILRYSEGAWSLAETPLVSEDDAILAIWFSEQRNTGWAVSWNGTILSYEGGAWSVAVPLGTLTNHALLEVWGSPSGATGWAMGQYGTILRFQDGTWSIDETASSLTTETLTSVSVSESGTKAWAVGSEGTILRFQDGAWSIDEEASAVTDQFLSDVWVSESGDRGWAVGNGGTVLHYQNGAWSLDELARAATSVFLNGVWASRSGDQAWVMGGERSSFTDPHGVRLSYKNDSWKLESGKVTGENLNSLWISETGDQGWAVGASGTILQYQNGAWSLDAEASSVTDASLYELWMTKSGDQGWAVGTHGTILRYASNAWSVDETVRAVTNEDIYGVWGSRGGDKGWALPFRGAILQYRNGAWSSEGNFPEAVNSLESVWMSGDDEQGWAFGRDGTILRYRDGTWFRETSPVRDQILYSVWISESEDVGWVVGTNGTALRYQDDAWSLEATVASATEAVLNSVASSESGDRAWAVGEAGTILRYQNDTWALDEMASSLTSTNLNSVWVSATGEEYQAVGDKGTILSGRNVRLTHASIASIGTARLEELAGNFQLRLDASSPVRLVSPPEIRLTDDNGINQLPAADYEIRPAADNPLEFVVELNARGLAERLEHREHHLEVHLPIVHPSRQEIVLTTDGFYVQGRPPWMTTVALAGTLLGLNVLLLLLAVPSTWVRTVMLHPVGSAAVGLVLGKYLLTDWLIRFVHPLKLAMFRDYRKRLAESPAIRHWDERLYVPPTVTVEREPISDDQVDAKDQWRRLLQHLVDEPHRRLWLILGESGLGKTTLLEQWTGLALSRGEMPFLIRLGSDLRPEEEAASLMAQFGDVNVNAKTAMDLLTGGGFLVFLDGFNEDRTPDATREFVRQVSKRNLVVMTSQLDPRWDCMVDVHRIRLEAFGTDQLSELLGAEWTKKVLESPHLAAEARLPMTAKLLAAFVESKGKLPGYGLQVYQELREALQGSELFNLDAQAWELFKANRDEFEPGDGLPPEFCDRAVDHGVLTRRSRDGEPRYRFVHERIHRYFVAAYLHRQGGQTVYRAYEEAEKVRRDLGKERWRVALEFWGEMIARGVPGGRGGDAAYREFLREVAEFDAAIFAQALYPQYDRLCTSGLLTPDEDFVRWAARFMAEATL